MKPEFKKILTPIAVAVAGALAVYGCGSSSNSTDSTPAPAVVPVGGALVNTPIDGAPLIAKCADGTSGGTGVSTKGTYTINVTCAASNWPIVVAIDSSKIDDGTYKPVMAGPDMQFGPSDDELYKTTERPPLKVAVESVGAAANAANMNAVTTIAAQPIEDKIAAFVAAPTTAAKPVAADVTKAESDTQVATGVTGGIKSSDPVRNPDTARFAAQVLEAASMTKAGTKPEDVMKAIAQAANTGANGTPIYKTGADGTSSFDIGTVQTALTAAGRVGILAHRPAPIQVSYLGYPGTLGAGYVDYIVADPHVIPPEDRMHYSEKVVYLPDTYQVNDAQRRIAERTPHRAELGLPENGFVFCCFNNNYKIGPAIFDVWMRLLTNVEGSVFWLFEDNSAALGNLRREAEKRGVSPDRLVFAQRMRLEDHLARQKLADLFLDTLPYNAHTTASDALWAGLPVLTCTGSTFAGRVASSLLNAAGLPELITHSLDEYEAMAIRLASSPAMLDQIRAKVAGNRAVCPLFDTDRFRRHLESAYMTMWERYQRGELPASFAVQRP